MQIAALPSDEELRLADLFSYDILDSETEKEFDELTELAAQICNCPTSLITFIAKDRQWFKSKIGLDGPATETLRELSFCSHTILEKRVLIIEDTHKDVRFHDNPYVVGEPKIRFYAGAPIASSGGRNLGSVCVLNQTPMEFTPQQQRALTIIAQQVTKLLDLRLRNKTVCKQAKALLESKTTLLLKQQQLEQSNNDLQQFAHVASHDLKEPIRKIKAFGSRLKEEYQAMLPERGKMYLDKIDASATRMYTLIEEVLQYASLSAAGQSSQPVDLNEVMAHIESDLEMLIQQKGALIEYQQLPQLKGTPVLIYQLFYNLISNALKFSKPDEQPVVRLCSTVADKKEVAALNLPQSSCYTKILVQDNGIGFKEEQAEAIFNTFARLHSKDQYEGTGLGLALCKKIVQQHNGWIKATGVVNKGASFAVYLPLCKSDNE